MINNYISNYNNITCSMVFDFDLEKNYRITVYIIDSSINFIQGKHFIIDNKNVIESYQKMKLIDRELDDKGIQIDVINFQQYDEFILFYQSK